MIRMQNLYIYDSKCKICDFSPRDCNFAILQGRCDRTRLCGLSLWLSNATGNLTQFLNYKGIYAKSHLYNSKKLKKESNTYVR